MAPTHAAVATVGIKAPLGIIQVPTVPPSKSEIRVHVEYVASTPLDIHQNDGGLLVTHPQVLGDSCAGTVVEVGEEVKNLKVGDKVFGFVWKSDKERAQQEFVTAEWWQFGKVPDGVTLAEAVTLPNNFVTAWHTLTMDLGFSFPWPKPDDYIPKDSDEAILIWGGASSVGQYAIQLLKYYGYTNIIAAASTKHHAKLQELGANVLFDYRNHDVVEKISNAGAPGGVKKILDCIGSVEGSIRPISKIAKKGANVAILLPVIVRDSSETEDPEYAMDVKTVVNWEEGVEPKGVRTHFYLENEFHKNHLQPEIMPTLLKSGIVKPNAYRLIEGETLLERAQKALNALRRKEVSGERLVWKVGEVDPVL